ncbi:MAG: OmpA family protein [Opitutaceae bacterium]|nr:OmpA family protein [Cytophagales bacterium]
MKVFLHTYCLTILLLLGISQYSLLYSQNKKGIETHLSVSKMKARAAHASKMGDPYTALFYYEEIVKKDPSDLEMRYDLAELYQLTRNYPMAEKYFDYVYGTDEEGYPIALYHKAIMQKMQGKYPEAKTSLKEFKKIAKSISDKGIKMLLDRDIAGCDSGIMYTAFPENIKLENAGKSINNPHAEFSPVYTSADNIVFGSLRMDSIQYYDIREEYKEIQPKRKVYLASLENGAWTEKGLMEELDWASNDIGDITYSKNTDRYYFSKCQKSEDAKPRCKLYYTDKTKKHYLLNHPVNQEGFTSTQPAIMYDSATKTETLFYVSDRAGSKGGLDIWYASYNPAKKKWNNPANFSVVNTPGMEFSPFVDSNGQNIYFSSNGHGSAGGLDVYKIKKEGKKYSRPENLGFPINSPQDDFDYSQNEKGDKGFVVSNRPGGTPYFHETCCDDIFMFEKLPELPFNKTIDLVVKSEDSCQAPVLLTEKVDKRKSVKLSDNTRLENCRIKYNLYKNSSYKFSAVLPGYTSDTLQLSYQDILNSDSLKGIINLKKILPKSAALAANLNKGTNIQENLGTVAKDNANLTAGTSITTRTTLENLNDSDLNGKRSATNEKIVEAKEKSEVSNTDKPKSWSTNKNKLAPKSEKKIKYVKPATEEVPTLEAPFTLKDFQYEYGSAEMTVTSKNILDSLLVPFLKQNSTRKLVVASHTDNIGSHHFNIQLSMQRAQLVKSYLVERGIEAQRITYKGYGETRPIAPNQNPDGSDDPIGRGLNRRTEFNVVK